VVTKRIDTSSGEDFGLSEDAQKREAAYTAWLEEMAGKTGAGLADANTSEAYNGVSRALKGGPATQVINMV